MKGVRVLLDEASNKRIIQIEVDDVDPSDELLENLVDIILAEDAKKHEMIPWEEAKAMLRAAGKL